MAYKGLFDLEYEDKTEQDSFQRTRRLTGHHSNVVKAIYPEEAYADVIGEHWSEPEALGRGIKGNFGMALRYATIDEWYKKQAIAKGKFTAEEVDRFYDAWKSVISERLPLSNERLLKMWRDNRKTPNKHQEIRRRKKKARRTQAFEQNFRQDRNPRVIYKQLEAALPSSSPLDKQILKQLARLLANANDLLYQAEMMKESDGTVPIEDLGDFNKLHDLILKTERNVLQLQQQHGYDYQTRRKRKEAQTAAEIFDDFVDQAADLFDKRAIEFLCPHCNMSLGYFLRHFPTIKYAFTVPRCPRCGNDVKFTFDPLPDEVMSFG